jgi:hypothetical protein
LKFLIQIFTGILLFILIFNLIPHNILIGNVVGATEWTQTSDTDFNNGIFNNVTLIGTGKGSHLTLSREFNWINQSPSNQPGNRYGHEMVAINGTDKIVLFGGRYHDGSNDFYLNDTWVYDTSENSWIKKHPQSSPSGRVFHGMAAIDNDDKILLFGGHYYDDITYYYYGDTWIYDLSDNNWSKKSLNPHPSNRSYHEMSTIYGTDKVLLYGGIYDGYETWIFDLSANKWTEKSPQNYPTYCRYYTAMAPIHGTDKVLIFGGTDSFFSWWDYSRFTYIYDLSDNNWTFQNVINHPFKRAGHSMASVSNEDKVILFGGVVGGSSMGWTTFGDTWEFDLSECNWTEKVYTTKPLKRYHHDMVSIYGKDDIILFGGFCPGASQEFQKDTWKYSLSSYKNKGNYTSMPFNIKNNSTFIKISWNASTSVDATIKFQLRTASTEEGLEVQEFLGPDGTIASYYTSTPSTIWSGHQQLKWIQYKGYFSTVDSKDSAVLGDVTIWYNYWPECILTGPENNSILNINSPRFDWDFIDLDTESQEKFQVLIDDDQNFSNVDYNSSELSSVETFWQFPNGTSYTGLSDGTWYWKVKIKDIDGSWGLYSSPFMVTIDTIAPSSTIYLPQNDNYYNKLDYISGTAVDPINGTGIKEIKVIIKRKSDNYYWSGSSWQSEEISLLASGTNEWTLDSSAVTWKSGYQYIIQSRALDYAGNVELIGSENQFIFDMDKPASKINFPADNSYLKSVEIISGTACDFGGSDIDIVEISIERISDGKYWDGYSWSIDESWSPTIGTIEWYYDSNNIQWSSDLKYNIQSRAKDRGKNLETPGSGITFMFDIKPPTKLKIVINNDKEFINTTGVDLNLNSEDSGSGVYNMSFSTDGITWTQWEPYNISKTFILSTGDGEKIVYFKVQDRAGNIADHVVDSIFLDSTPPTELSIIINDNCKYTNSIQETLFLSASDSLSGIFEMSFSFNGKSWDTWEPYSNLKSITLPASDGEKTIYFAVNDYAKNLAIKSKKIILDTSSPHSSSITINNGAIETNSSIIYLKISAKDNLSGVYQMSFSNNGEQWSEWENYSSLKEYELLSGDGVKTIYFRVKDQANKFYLIPQHLKMMTFRKIRINNHLVISIFIWESLVY